MKKLLKFIVISLNLIGIKTWAVLSPNTCDERLSAKNQEFYSSFSYADYDSSLSLGWHLHQDLDVIKDYISNAKSIVEIGGGVGRIVNGLLTRTENTQIDVIELNEGHTKILEQKFTGNNRVRIHRASILSPPSDIKNKSLALWMFSGIYDLGRTEQDEAFRKINQMLDTNGYLIIDIPNKEDRPELLGSLVQFTYDDITSVIYLTYSTSDDDFIEYAKKSGFTLSEKRYYGIHNNRSIGSESSEFPRISYVFKKVSPIID